MANILRYQNWLNENRIFEDDADPSLYIDWKGKMSGPFPALGIVDGDGKTIIGIGAKHKTGEDAKMRFGSTALRNAKWAVVNQPKSTPATTTPPQAAPPTITPSVDFKGTDFPYPDNIITPNWTVAQAAKVLFDGFITNLVDYFKLDSTQAKNNFKSIAIEGAADIAPATTAIPSGYTQLDHNYGGAKPSNEFLAENRAIKMKEEIVKALTTTGKLTPDLITFISGKITITFKTGLPRGGRYVKITTAASPYDVKTSGAVTPGTTTPGTTTPAAPGTSGEITNTYSVLRDQYLGYFFGQSPQIETSAIKPWRDLQKVELSKLQEWAKEYLGGELLSTEEVRNLTATVEGTVDELGTEEATISWNVPTGKVFAPVSDVAGNAINTIKCSEDNARTLSRAGSMYQNGTLTGFPFVISYALIDLEDGQYGILTLDSVSLMMQ
jgi:hypothetical protein